MRRTYIDEHGDTIVQIDAEDLGPLTQEQIAMIERAAKKPITYDEDCPPMSEEMKARMRERIQALNPSDAVIA